MKLVFVDTNIIVDFLAARVPFGKFALAIFNLAQKKQVKLYTSSHSFATAYYLLKKHVNDAELRSFLSSLLDMVEVIPVDIVVIKKSLLSKHKDFKDAIQIFAANTIANIDFIVTRNLKDFKDADIKVLPPDELLNYL